MNQDIDQTGADAYRKMTEKYRDIQLGHISGPVMPFNHSLPLADAVMYLEENADVPGLSGEEYNKIIGILSRETAATRAHSRIELLKGKSIKSYLQDDTVIADASVFCEQLFSKVIRVEDRVINNVIIYEAYIFPVLSSLIYRLIRLPEKIFSGSWNW